MTKVDQKELYELKMKALISVHDQARLNLARLQNNHTLHISEDSGDNIPAIMKQYEDLKNYITDQEYIRRVHKHGHTKLIALITQQLKDFYPKRLKEYENNELSITIYYLVDESDYKYFNQIRKEASITEPTCVMVVGFHTAILFVGPVLMDIEKGDKNGNL